MVRKNISLAENDYEIILDYAMSHGISFSEVLRKAALQFINMQEELNLAEFLNKQLDYVSESEQLEIDMLAINFDDESGEEMTINDFL